MFCYLQCYKWIVIYYFTGELKVVNYNMFANQYLEHVLHLVGMTVVEHNTICDGGQDEAVHSARHLETEKV
jgi:hypothetical protein